VSAAQGAPHMAAQCGEAATPAASPARMSGRSMSEGAYESMGPHVGSVHTIHTIHGVRSVCHALIK
jgi:hypothetical protein